MDQPARARPELDPPAALPVPLAAPSRSRRGLLTGAGWVTGAMTAANLLGYALNLVASRRLGPTDFGVVGALLGVVVVANVAALALQAVVARRVAMAGDTIAVRRVAASTAAGTGLLAVAAVPVLVVLLHLDSPLPALWTAAVTVPLALTGAQLGLLQGRERFGRLAVGYVVAATGKVGGGLVGLAVVPSPAGVLGGTAVGALLGWLATLPLAGAAGSTRGPRVHGAGTGAAAAGAEVLRAGQALFAFFLLTNVDVLAARHYLAPRDAGLYAVGAVVAKGAFWLPSAVPVLLLPRLVDRSRSAASLRIGLLAVTAAGTVSTGVCLLAGDLVVRLVGGSAYAALAGHLWLFALAGSLFAVAQLLLYSRLARADHAASAVLWLVLVAYVLTLLLISPQEPVRLVLVAVAAAAATVAGGALVESHRGRATRGARP